MDAITFGEYLRQLRLKRGFNLKQLATHAGVSSSYLSEVERGRRGIPCPRYLSQLAKPLLVDSDDLMRAAGLKGPRPAEVVDPWPSQVELVELGAQDLPMLDQLKSVLDWGKRIIVPEKAPW